MKRFSATSLPKAAVGSQRRTMFPPQITVTGLPAQDYRTNMFNIQRSFVAWETRVPAKKRESEQRFGPIGSRADPEKCKMKGLESTDVVQLNVYEGGSFVARNDLISGPENEHVYTEWPNTEKKYLTKYLRPRAKDDYERRVKFYAMLAVPRATTLFLGKSTLVALLLSFGPKADMKAMANAEVAIDWVEPGQFFVAMWQGKPCFIHHRTEQQIAKVSNTTLSELRDPEDDKARHKDPKWAIMIAICTHLGCIPVFGSGDYGAYLCPCHGSHYDFSGRIRKGPAPKNLEIPPYYFIDDGTVLIGKNAP